MAVNRSETLFVLRNVIYSSSFVCSHSIEIISVIFVKLNLVKFVSTETEIEMKFSVFMKCLCISICCVSSLALRPGTLGFTDDVKVTDKVFIDYFNGLPAELQKIILSFLPFAKLFEFAQNAVFKDYHELAAEAYGVSYGHLTVYAVKNGNENFKVIDDTIHFNDFNMFCKFIKSFNRHIKNLLISFATEPPNCWEFCSQSIIKFGVENLSYENFEIFKKLSFPQVEELSFFDSDFDKNLDLSRSFPNVRRLSCTSTSFTDRTWVEKSFPNLTHLQVDMSSQRWLDASMDHGLRENGAFTQDEIIRILERNPNIFSLNIRFCVPEILPVINEHFPNIIEMNIFDSYFIFNPSHVIRMEHVEKFMFMSHSTENPSCFIVLENLRELTWYDHNGPRNVFYDFMKNHKHQIEVIELAQGVIEDEDLLAMFNMKKLQRASIHFSTAENTITANGVWSFIKSNEQLLNVHLFNVDQKLRNELYKTFESTYIPGEIEAFDPQANQTGDIHFIKNTHR